MRNYGMILALYLMTAPGIASDHGNELYFVDAHSQVDHNIALDVVIERMKKAGIRKTILAARGRRQSDDIARLAETHPELVVAAVRTKGRHYKQDSKKYYRELAREVDSGRFHAMAEVLLYHAQKGDRAGEVAIHADENRVQAAFAAARKQGWPFVVHIEFASLGTQRSSFMKTLEALLTQPPRHPIVLIHMGQLNTGEVQKLIDHHPNIYFMTSHSNPVAVNRSNQPWTNLFEGDVLAPAWQALMVAHPARFILALDNVWPEHWRNDYDEQVVLWRKALGELPSPVAHAIAHGNAEVLWKLEQKPDN